jgi:hypothetical protein
MIIVKLMGGLGNQMFQYAAGKSLAVKNNSELLLDTSSFDAVTDNITKRKFELSCLHVNEEMATAQQVQKFEKPSLLTRVINKTRPYYKKSVYYEPHFHFDPNFFKASPGTMLVGYWQSEKYFSSISSVIRDNFAIKNKLSAATLNIYEQASGTNSVSIHIRRGDYISNPETKRVHGSCDLEYYEKAIETLIERSGVTHLFIFSDDISWARQNIRSSLTTVFVDHNGEQQAYEDLYLMSNCKHNIIANSSFSWWGAWLNNNPGKNVIAPKKWFNDFPADTKDLYPSNWITI